MMAKLKDGLLVRRAERGGSLPRGMVRKGIAGLVVVLILACSLAASLIGSTHAFTLHNLPFGVTGSSSLVSAVGKKLSLKTIQYPNQSAVEQAIAENKIYVRRDRLLPPPHRSSEAHVAEDDPVSEPIRG